MRSGGIIIATIILLVPGVLGYFWTTHVRNDGVDNSYSLSESGGTLSVSPEAVRGSVIVDSAVLTRGGYVVVRGSDGKRLGQIIEISPYLEPGEHTNINIPLGDFYSYNESDQLIAMIYRDGGDRTFNDLDRPAGGTAAVFVTTGKSVPVSVFGEQVVAQGGMGMETVRYTNSGFRPAKLTVPVGTMIEFVNQSDNGMWVASNVRPEH